MLFYIIIYRYLCFFLKKKQMIIIYIWLYKYGYINIYVITNDYKWLFINMFFLIYIIYIHEYEHMKVRFGLL
jgi:hypothetical protein